MPSIDKYLDSQITVEEWRSKELVSALCNMNTKFLWYDEVSRRFLTETRDYLEGHERIMLRPASYTLKHHPLRLFIHPFPKDTLFTHHLVAFDKRRQDVPIAHYILVDAGTVVAFYDDATRQEALRDAEDEWGNVDHGQRIRV